MQQLRGQLGALAIEYLPAHHLAAEDVHEQVQVEEHAAHLGGQVGDVPAVDLVGPCGHQGARFAAFLRHSFSIEDDGRGHAIGRSVEGSPYLDFIYCHLDYPYEERKAKPIQLQGLGMSLLNRLCAELIVSVRKTEATLTLRFQSGRLVSHELNEATNQVTGNKVSGTVHPDLGPAPIDERALEQWLQELLAASPLLQLVFNGQQLEPLASGAQR